MQSPHEENQTRDGYKGPDSQAPAEVASTQSGPELSTKQTTTLTKTPPLEEIPPYRPDGGCSPAGWALLTAAVIAASIAVGDLYHVIADCVDLIGLLPLLMGFLLGWLIALGIRVAKCRNPAVAVTCAVLAGVLTYGGRIYFDSMQARPAMIQQMSEKISSTQNVPTSEARAWLERKLTPWQTFRIFVKAGAEGGVFIGPGFYGDWIAGPWYWILLLIEMGAIAAPAILLSKRAASTVFCAKCGRWCSEHSLVQVFPQECDLLEQKIRDQDWQGIRRLARSGSIYRGHYCESLIARCPACKEIQISLVNRSGRAEECLLNARLAPESAARLVETKGG